VPTFEDKVAQRAIVMVLEAIYEQDFLSCSFGFRPGRSAHQALSALRLAFMGRKGLRWVLDVDISKYRRFKRNNRRTRPRQSIWSSRRDATSPLRIP
jgi:retron-type reverse transcriptase